jgi:hypothetical protein
MVSKSGFKHDCGDDLYSSIRSDDIWVCVKCQIDVPKVKKKVSKYGRKK